MEKRKPATIRDHSIDNIRFILIFLVVFAHLLEVPTSFGGRIVIYKFIYSFHLPAFLFLFGYNAKFSLKRIIFRWCIPYVIFQCVYLLFVKYVLKTGVTFQFKTPFWLLWYMMVSIYYQLLLPILDKANKPAQVLLLGGSFVLAILIGKVDSIGYDLSLSRAIVLLPWFMLGFFCKKNQVLRLVERHRAVCLSASAACAMIMASLASYVKYLPYGILYSCLSYAAGDGTMRMRAAVFVMSASAIVILFLGIKPYLNREIPVITYIGKNTWPVFLLHGFIVKTIQTYYPEIVSPPIRLFLITSVILLLLGNKFCSNAIYYACFSWLEKIRIKKGTEK